MKSLSSPGWLIKEFCSAITGWQEYIESLLQRAATSFLEIALVENIFSLFLSSLLHSCLSKQHSLFKICNFLTVLWVCFYTTICQTIFPSNCNQLRCNLMDEFSIHIRNVNGPKFWQFRWIIPPCSLKFAFSFQFTPWHKGCQSFRSSLGAEGWLGCSVCGTKLPRHQY